MTIYTAEELASILKVSTRTVREMLADGEIRYFLVGKSKRVAEEDLAQYVRESRSQCQWTKQKAASPIDITSSSKVVGFRDQLARRQSAKR